METTGTPPTQKSGDCGTLGDTLDPDSGEIVHVEPITIELDFRSVDLGARHGASSTLTRSPFISAERVTSENGVVGVSEP